MKKEGGQVFEWTWEIVQNAVAVCRKLKFKKIEKVRFKIHIFLMMIISIAP